MTDFFDQICKVLVQNGKKYPGNAADSPCIREFFSDIAPEVRSAQTVETPFRDEKFAPASDRVCGNFETENDAASEIPDTDRINTVSSAQDVRNTAVTAANLHELAAAVHNCGACPLAMHRSRIVFGEGNPDARLMFVGEAPGYDEDQQGRPFVGKAGQLLDKMIAAMQFSREEVYIANTVKCHPEGNRNPVPDEVFCCLPLLERQIDLIRPEVIVVLGAVAAKVLLNTENGISRLRGKWCSYKNIPVMPTFHPAFLLRQESAKREAWQDLQLVMARFGKFYNQGKK